MFSKVTQPHPARMSLAFGLLASAAAFAAAPALAGECPADQVAAGAVTPGETMPVGVTDEVLSAIDLSSKGDAWKGNMLRMRKLVVQPGGVVPWHEHSARPANILVVEGSITEYRSNCKVPIEHKAGDVDRRVRRSRPLVEEQRQGAGRPLLGRHPAAGDGRAHDVSAASPRPSPHPPTFPAR